MESHKQVNVKDWLTISRSTISEPPQTASNHKDEDKALDLDTKKDTGIKRPRSDSSQSPSHNKFTSNGCSSEHLVYVRRKLEIENRKLNSCSHVPSDGSTRPKVLDSYEKLQFNSQQEEENNPRFASFTMYQSTSGAPIKPSFGHPGKTLTGLPRIESNKPVKNIASPPMSNRQESSGLHWKDRFLQVQAYLRECDQSNQEEYIQMLRSLSPVERNDHAVALEKRAIHLILEEGKELHLMRVLNVFGKTSPDDQNAVSVDKY